MPATTPYAMTGASQIAADYLGELDSNEQRMLSFLASRLVGAGQFEEAATAFEILVQAHEDHAFYHRALGICRERTDRLLDAERSLVRALELAPRDSFARTTLAAVQIRLGQYQAAMSSLRVAQRDAAPDNDILNERIAAMKRGVCARLGVQ